ncbi:MAG: alanine--tRNA ligase, partial [Chloroflexota bacterium]
SSLVPGGDATLLFTNAGMVQFKDVFLGTDQREYQRATNSQKCMRVAGKHNDLEDVGQDDTHHTFFEMMGNWSFGDYYKKEAIEWAWELLTDKWKLPKENLYVTVFKDEQDEIPTDEDAAKYWEAQPGLDPQNIIYSGRADNFWEMANTGPCGPNSEIHIDMGPDYGEMTYHDNGAPDLDGPRFLELWNLVFIQYNRTGPKSLDPLPATHVDTGMGFERIVAVLQNKDSNYRTDIFWPIIQKIKGLSGHNDKQVEENFTPYRVIADHVRSAAFLIADGVVPGNLGRNYVTRMVIRRAARFGTKIGLEKPFLASVAEVVIENYGEAYPELIDNKSAILTNLTLEEERFQKTVESGIGHLENLLGELTQAQETELDGEKSFDLYATYGLPMEITRDIAQERGLSVDEQGFKKAMEKHRLASGGGKAMGELGGEDAEVFRKIFKALLKSKQLSEEGVIYNPYERLETEGKILSIIKDGAEVKQASLGDEIEFVLPETNFYVAAGGQVSDTGILNSTAGKDWQVEILDTRQPAAGIISHKAKVTVGSPKVGDKVLAQVDAERRQHIKRNHTATHLLHSELHKVLGDHARQAGSLVAPDRLRFDFTHQEALTPEEILKIEDGVNQNILKNYALRIEEKSIDEAKAEGAIALFGEKYGEVVRTIQIGEGKPFSYELCGGTHVETTGEIGTFIITSEGSAASGIRRIEAITGTRAYEVIQERLTALNGISTLLKVPGNKVAERVNLLSEELSNAQKEVALLKRDSAASTFDEALANAPEINGTHVLAMNFP